MTQGGKDRFAEFNAQFFEYVVNQGLRNVFFKRPRQICAQFFLYFSPVIVDIIVIHYELLFDKIVLTYFFIG